MAPLAAVKEAAPPRVSAGVGQGDGAIEDIIISEVDRAVGGIEGGGAVDGERAAGSLADVARGADAERAVADSNIAQREGLVVSQGGVAGGAGREGDGA